MQREDGAGKVAAKAADDENEAEERRAGPAQAPGAQGEAMSERGTRSPHSPPGQLLHLFDAPMPHSPTYKHATGRVVSIAHERPRHSDSDLPRHEGLHPHMKPEVRPVCLFFFFLPTPLLLNREIRPSPPLPIPHPLQIPAHVENELYLLVVERILRAHRTGDFSSTSPTASGIASRPFGTLCTTTSESRWVPC